MLMNLGGGGGVKGRETGSFQIVKGRELAGSMYAGENMQSTDKAA